MSGTKKAIPEFKNEIEEFEFWSPIGPGADSTKYLDWTKAGRKKLPNLQSPKQLTTKGGENENLSL